MCDGWCFDTREAACATIRLYNMWNRRPQFAAHALKKKRDAIKNLDWIFKSTESGGKKTVWWSKSLSLISAFISNYRGRLRFSSCSYISSACAECIIPDSCVFVFLPSFNWQVQFQKIQQLRLSQTRAPYYGGSLPNVNQIGNTSAEFQVGFNYSIKCWIQNSL